MRSEDVIGVVLEENVVKINFCVDGWVEFELSYRYYPSLAWTTYVCTPYEIAQQTVNKRKHNRWMYT